MKFDMAITDNFASFYDEKEGSHIFIDSFDNENFELFKSRWPKYAGYWK